MTLEAVAKKLGSHKGYGSGIETDKVNPPSVKLIRKFAKIFGQDARTLARLAWVDKAPAILREDAEDFLKWIQRKEVAPEMKLPSPAAPGAPPSPTAAPKN